MRQLKTYYTHAMNTAIKDFEIAYSRYLLLKKDNKTITPNTLYTIDKYWSMQNDLGNTLRALGDKEYISLQNNFLSHYQELYNMLEIPEHKSTPLDLESAKATIQTIWCADGKSFSDRIWDDKERLLQSLNEALADAVVTGKDMREFKKDLANQFSVSYHRANTLVRTELCVIQTKSAVDRYKSYGVKKVKFITAKDEKVCPICNAMSNKVIDIDNIVIGTNAPPRHPNDRCCLIPLAGSI